MHCPHRNPTVPESYTSVMAAQDTAVHEIDVLRRLLDDEIVSARVITPRATSKRFAHLEDPQVMLFETANGVAWSGCPTRPPSGSAPPDTTRPPYRRPGWGVSPPPSSPWA
ncbi:Inositol 2-dehydrogenase [Streptomyces olivochromogenes]|uniref:Inositol 2-dehydrogenase n=1 Tax=Streptomyces olivochromogenes TaxID=1963 RepID=A0A250VVV5_STROL|nr:Inositol 2-dehydrogenase [Streptomyces olivochromogenes]